MPGLRLDQLIQDPRLLPLADKVEDGTRLSSDDGLLLYETPDLTGVAALAGVVRERLHGKKTYFVQGRRLSYSNICASGCRFCAFHAPPGDPKGFALTAEEVVGELKEAKNSGIRELHMVGGHNPALGVEYFESLFRAIKGHFPDLHLKVFTMVEIAYYASNSGISTGEFIDRCIEAGLGSCPGGGAEIFNTAIRQAIAPGKGDADVWLATARLCHQKGLPTNCTMLYGHLEGAGHKVDHLLRLRGLQDESLGKGKTGFLAYIPLAFQTHGNPLARASGIQATTGTQDLREIAVARLMLDNVSHVKAYWVMITPGLAQVGLSYGADDLDGTVFGEEIAHRAGAKTPTGLTVAEVCRLITEAGYDPVERDTLYRTV